MVLSKILNFLKLSAIQILVFILLVPIAYSFGVFDEIIPREELLQSVIVGKIDLNTNVSFKTDFNFEYSGRYVVFLVLKESDKTKEGTEDFTLTGSIQLNDKEGKYLYKTDFIKVLSNRNTGVTLHKFEINKKQVKGIKEFFIEFGDGVQKMNQYFSSTEIHVKKELKHSIFD